MKKVKILPFIGIILFLLIAAFTVITPLFAGEKTASATTDREPPRPVAETYIESYDISIDVDTNRAMKIVEDVTVYFYNNTGFIRDIPVNAGEVVRNVRVCEIVGGAEKSVAYSVGSSSDDKLNRYVSVDIGDYSTKFKESHTYRIEYGYCLTKTQEGKEFLALTPVGAGWDCMIYDIQVKLTLPEGYIMDDSTFCSTVDITGYEQNVNITETVSGNGKPTLITDKISYIKPHSQVRFDVHFQEGVLSTYFDFTPYICVIIGAIILAAIVGVKFIFFNKNKIVPVVNFEAPNKMDPLMMGKLIDNKVDASDITSLIYYFAGKGWLKIAFEEKDSEPTLIRTVKSLPVECADYEKTTFGRLFNGRDAVRPSELKYKFYTAIPNITAQVNAKTQKLFSRKSLITSAVFAAIGALLLAVVPVIFALAQVSAAYSVFSLLPLFAVLIPGIVVFALSQMLRNNELKYSATKKALYYLGVIALCAVLSVFYVLLVPSFIIALPVKISLCAVCSAIVMTSAIILERNESYVKQLNDIIGFKNFIKLVEKKQLETMLEDDPQFYYHILPYAQVLGVSDVWEEKFKDITIQPPDWHTASNVVSFYIMNRMISRSFGVMKSGMITRPGSSGASGFSGGGRGGFGGHSGGGHGGGGGRFR